MVGIKPEQSRPNWRLPLYGGCVWFAVYLALSFDEPDIFVLVGFFLLVPALLVASMVLPICAAFRKRHQLLPVAVTLAVLWAVSASFICFHRVYPFALHESLTWLVSSRDYKREVLAQPAPANGGLNHMMWDGSGFAGIETNVYLVFDPTNKLSAAVRSHMLEKSDGEYCHVRLVRRLERNWYTVVFFTDQDWESCN